MNNSGKSSDELYNELKSLTQQQSLEIESLKQNLEKVQNERDFETLLLDSFLNITPENVYFKDKESRFLRISKVLFKKFGLSDLSQLVGKTDFDIFSDEHASQAFNDEMKIIETGEPLLNVVEKETYEDGSVTYVSTIKSPLVDKQGDIVGTFGVSRDITKLKRAEEDLRVMKDKFSILFESMSEMVLINEMVFDEHGEPINYRILDCNSAFAKFMGDKYENIVGCLITDVFKLDIPPFLYNFLDVALGDKQLRFEFFLETMRKYLSVSAVGLGANIFATISTDITHEKHMQSILAAKNKELEQIVYIASHDLRSPLVNADGYSRELEYSIQEVSYAAKNEDLSKDEIIKLLSTELPDMVSSLQYIRNSTQQMDNLLKSLLKYSRLGRAALNIEMVDMNELMHNVSRSFEFQVVDAGVTVTIGDMPPCKGDTVQLTQIFSNLIGNAIKYLDSDRPGVITVSGKEEAGMSVYCVEDNGVGIPESKYERIFELFQRLNPTDANGEGLGLTIVRQALMRLGGDVRVESNPGQGTRFYVCLPIA